MDYPLPDKDEIRRIIAEVQAHEVRGYVVTRSAADKMRHEAVCANDVKSKSLNVKEHDIRGVGPWLLQRLLYAYRTKDVPSLAAAARDLGLFSPQTFHSYYFGAKRSVLSAEIAEKVAIKFAQGDETLYRELLSVLETEPRLFPNEFAKRYLVGYAPEYRVGKWAHMGEESPNTYGAILTQEVEEILATPSAPPASALPVEIPINRVIEARIIEKPHGAPSKKQITEARRMFRIELGNAMETMALSPVDMAAQVRMYMPGCTFEHIRNLTSRHIVHIVQRDFAVAAIAVLQRWNETRGADQPELPVDYMLTLAKLATMEIDQDKGSGSKTSIRNY